MHPTDFPQSNFTFTKPNDMTEDQCGDLKVYKGEDSNNTPLIVSRWQPSAQEIEAINNGECIWLFIVGNGMPPVFLTCENPFAQTT